MSEQDELRRLEQAATPGPWYSRDGGSMIWGPSAAETCDVILIESWAYGSTPGICGPHSSMWPLLREDAEFIAEARNALPQLLDDLAALEAKLEAMGRTIRRYLGEHDMIDFERDVLAAQQEKK